jgi:predicted Rossmann-fold nucleotide-binding protein
VALPATRSRGLFCYPLDMPISPLESIPMITMVISGGQTGADQAGWRAAEACGIPPGGWMPRGFLTEDGPQRWFANVYGAREMPTASYPARTVQNVRDSDGTIWFGSTDSPGARATL